MASQRELEALEDLWRGKLGQAWAQYEDAKASKSEEEAATAHRECMRILRIFRDMVFYGRMPPEE